MVDPLGGINTLWLLFGIANQMLAALALTLGTVVLFRMKKDHYAWVTVVPTVWLLALYADCRLDEAVFSRPARGFVATARKFSAEVARHQAEGTLPEKGPRSSRCSRSFSTTTWMQPYAPSSCWWLYRGDLRHQGRAACAFAQQTERARDTLPALAGRWSLTPCQVWLPSAAWRMPRKESSSYLAYGPRA